MLQAYIDLHIYLYGCLGASSWRSFGVRKRASQHSRSVSCISRQKRSYCWARSFQPGSRIFSLLEEIGNNRDHWRESEPRRRVWAGGTLYLSSVWAEDLRRESQDHAQQQPKPRATLWSVWTVTELNVRINCSTLLLFSIEVLDFVHTILSALQNSGVSVFQGLNYTAMIGNAICSYAERPL